MVLLNEEQIADFQKIIKDFYNEHKRPMPWRETEDPYLIFLSEVMLQQTQVSRVLVKYPEFVSKFPTLVSLVDAPFSEVLAAWSGLGYNRRALFLHQNARILLETYHGDLPDSVEELETFKGIGHATACSILAFGKNYPVVFIETNIRRIFIHFFFEDKTSVADTEIESLVSQTLDVENPRQWYYALMDYGSMLAKTISNPNRRSKHYTRQSEFENSVRKVRGEVLRYLLTHKKATQETLRTQAGDTDKLTLALTGLQKDGLIDQKEDEFELRS